MQEARAELNSSKNLENWEMVVWLWWRAVYLVVILSDSDEHFLSGPLRFGCHSHIETLLNQSIKSSSPSNSLPQIIQFYLLTFSSYLNVSFKE